MSQPRSTLVVNASTVVCMMAGWTLSRRMLFSLSVSWHVSWRGASLSRSPPPHLQRRPKAPTRHIPSQSWNKFAKVRFGCSSSSASLHFARSRRLSAAATRNLTSTVHMWHKPPALPTRFQHQLAHSRLSVLPLSSRCPFRHLCTPSSSSVNAESRTRWLL